jgi:hypothetical protein
VDLGQKRLGLVNIGTTYKNRGFGKVLRGSCKNTAMNQSLDLIGPHIVMGE